MERLPSSITHRAMGGGVLSGVTAPLADAMGSADPVFGLVGDVLRIVEAQLTGSGPAPSAGRRWPRPRRRSGRSPAACRRPTAPAAIRSPAPPSSTPASTSRPSAASPSSPPPTAPCSPRAGAATSEISSSSTMATASARGYGHLSRFAVSEGQTIRKGDVVGFVGSTGRSTSPHVHYELLLNGAPTNPLRLLGR